jgi:hypothetical protein
VHSYWIFETQVMAKWIVGNQINNSILNHKTFDINVNSPLIGVHCLWQFFCKHYNVFLENSWIWIHMKVTSLQNNEIHRFTILGFSLKCSKKFVPFQCSFCFHVQNILQGWEWWVLPSLGCDESHMNMCFSWHHLCAILVSNCFIKMFITIPNYDFLIKYFLV